jgi:hypothetical protein
MRRIASEKLKAAYVFPLQMWKNHSVGATLSTYTTGCVVEGDSLLGAYLP